MKSISQKMKIYRRRFFKDIPLKKIRNLFINRNLAMAQKIEKTSPKINNRYTRLT
ncbi:MAG: hypothetical protein GY757_49150 [bacterium]|nr:hypothetical protein [bacterium]